MIYPSSNADSQKEYKLKIVHKKMLEWGMANLRDFPWRKTRDPYKILIAEIMLHRTQANQVEEIYNNFVERYPNFCSICDSTPDDITWELKTLGLNWRSNLIYKLSCIICKRVNGEIPLKKDELIELPGIGPYIASAFLCLVYNKPEPMLDTNTVRIIGRIFGLKINDYSRRNKKFEIIMQALIDLGNCRDVSLTMIDFAQAICRPTYPFCSECPIRDTCIFYKEAKYAERVH
jgi:A/G-specific adenine glycosylase